MSQHVPGSLPVRACLCILFHPISGRTVCHQKNMLLQCTALFLYPHIALLAAAKIFYLGLIMERSDVSTELSSLLSPHS
ncbi:hypothetical protein SCP_0505550 [Sparassis crispa]|uniref:Uncharacterized protein n=1 Tax=Sparassis crispa TaxID=139825 RepID=A0A401GP23_9APHY|nr:hypothetical protein SCP_0505550 [Sparassis crispa]GBE83504.1 hypothetical protein SCP_0505550 [Sparassis crispa]